MSIISHNIKLNIFIQNSRQRERYHDQVIRITEVVNNFPFNIKKKKLSSIINYITTYIRLLSIYIKVLIIIIHYIYMLYDRLINLMTNNKGKKIYT